MDEVLVVMTTDNHALVQTAVDIGIGITINDTDIGALIVLVSRNLSAIPRLITFCSVTGNHIGIEHTVLRIGDANVRITNNSVIGRCCIATGTGCLGEVTAHNKGIILAEALAAHIGGRTEISELNVGITGHHRAAGINHQVTTHNEVGEQTLISTAGIGNKNRVVTFTGNDIIILPQ